MIVFQLLWYLLWPIWVFLHHTTYHLQKVGDVGDAVCASFFLWSCANLFEMAHFCKFLHVFCDFLKVCCAFLCANFLCIFVRLNCFFCNPSPYLSRATCSYKSPALPGPMGLGPEVPRDWVSLVSTMKVLPLLILAIFYLLLFSFLCK